jgi:hypothetical protein
MHGRYIYRLAISAVGSSILRTNRDLEKEVEFHNTSRSYNWAGSWRKKPISPGDSSLLQLIRSQLEYQEVGVRVKGPHDIKMRIEEPCVQFYALEEEPLKQLASALIHEHNGHLINVMRPANADDANMLSNGYILRTRPSEWQYRVTLRDGKYSEQTKNTIKSYLMNLDQEVKVPQNLWLQLDNSGWIWGGYIYVKDAGLATILKLIDSRLVSKVEEFKMQPLDE